VTTLIEIPQNCNYNAKAGISATLGLRKRSVRYFLLSIFDHFHAAIISLIVFADVLSHERYVMISNAARRQADPSKLDG